MARTKITVIVLMLTFSISMLTARGGGRGRGESRNAAPSNNSTPSKDQIVEMVDDLENELGLSKAQGQEIKKVFEEHFAAKEGSRDSSENDREAHRTAMETKQEELDKNIKKYLTEEQEELYDKWEKSREHNRGGRN